RKIDVFVSGERITRINRVPVVGFLPDVVSSVGEMRQTDSLREKTSLGDPRPIEASDLLEEQQIRIGVPKRVPHLGKRGSERHPGPSFEKIVGDRAEDPFFHNHLRKGRSRIEVVYANGAYPAMSFVVILIERAQSARKSWLNVSIAVDESNTISSSRSRK